MSIIDHALKANEDFPRKYDPARGGRPARKIVVVTCMDPRLSDLPAILGLPIADIDVIRSGGPAVTEDVLGEIIVSNRVLGSKEILLLNHTGCGLTTFTDAELNARVSYSTGDATPSPMRFFSYKDPEQNTRDQIQKVRSRPWISKDVPVHGLLFDVATGRLREIKSLDRSSVRNRSRLRELKVNELERISGSSRTPTRACQTWVQQGLHPMLRREGAALLAPISPSRNDNPVYTPTGGRVLTLPVMGETRSPPLTDEQLRKNGTFAPPKCSHEDSVARGKRSKREVFLSRALERGHLVTAVVRQPGVIAEGGSPGLRVVIANPLSATDFVPLLFGQDVVVSCLGRTSRAAPFLLRAAAIATEAAISRSNPILRYLVISQALLCPTRNPLVLLSHLIYRQVQLDSSAMENIVRSSPAP